MTDDADRQLEARLHALVGGVNPPVVPAGDDVRRGRRRLFRMRVGMAGATGATLAVVLGITGLTAGNPTAADIQPATQGPPPTSLPTAPAESPSEEDVDTGTTTQDQGGAGQGGGSGAGPGSGPRSTSSSATSSASDSTGRSPGASGHGGTGQPWPSSSSHPSQTPSEPSGSPTASASESPGETPSQTPSTTTQPSPTGQPSPTTGPTSGPTTPPPTTTPTPTPPPADGVVRVHATLRYWNEVLATHLDPERDHLAPYARKTGNKQSTTRDGELFALGSKYAWESARGAATLQVRVATGWDQVDWACGATYADWTCHDGEVSDPDVVASEVAEHDGLRQVAVEHTDGQVVVLTAPAVSSADEDELLEAAADERLDLPGDAPVAPPTLSADAFAAAGQAQLVSAALGETWLQTSLDRVPSVAGDRTVSGEARGTLAWSATPVYSGGAWTCLKSYRSCVDVQVGDEVVHVAAVRKRAGGGWVIAHDGPSYVVSVYAADRTFARKRAYGFVTDPTWQPTR